MSNEEGIKMTSVLAVLAVLEDRGIFLRDGRALLTLEKCGAMRPGALAKKMECSAVKITRTSERLVESGWVERVPIARNRRGFLLSVTDEGRRVIAGILNGEKS